MCVAIACSRFRWEGNWRSRIRSRSFIFPDTTRCLIKSACYFFIMDCSKRQSFKGVKTYQVFSSCPDSFSISSCFSTWRLMNLHQDQQCDTIVDQYRQELQFTTSKTQVQFISLIWFRDDEEVLRFFINMGTVESWWVRRKIHQFLRPCSCTLSSSS